MGVSTSAACQETFDGNRAGLSARIYTAHGLPLHWWELKAVNIVYLSIGGSSRSYLSIPIMFGVNAKSHLQLGYNLSGNYEGSLYRLLVFSILGAAVTIDVVAAHL
jgi:hypothetical protein